MGATLYSLKEDQAAYRVLDFAHQLKPDNADTAELLFRLAVILGNKSIGEGDDETGFKYLSRAADLQPANPEVKNRLAEIKSRARPQ